MIYLAPIGQVHQKRVQVTGTIITQVLQTSQVSD